MTLKYILVLFPLIKYNKSSLVSSLDYGSLLKDLLYALFTKLEIKSKIYSSAN